MCNGKKRDPDVSPRRSNCVTEVWASTSCCIKVVSALTLGVRGTEQHKHFRSSKLGIRVNRRVLCEQPCGVYFVSMV